MTDFDKLNDLFIKRNKLYDQHCDYQDVTDGEVKSFKIICNDKELEIDVPNHECIGNTILFEIDSLYFEEIEKLDNEIKSYMK